MASPSTNASAPAGMVLPRGVVFDPNDDELVFHYLIPKIKGSMQAKDAPFFTEKDIYKHEPSELPSLAPHSKQEKYYFFAPLKNKGKGQGGKNAERRVPGGRWRKTGGIRYFNDSGKRIAKKTSLAYYKDEASKLVKGKWLMKEYMLLQPNQNNQKSKMTVCVMYPYWSKQRKHNQG